MNLIKRNEQEQEVQRMAREEVSPVSRIDENDDAFTLTLELPGVDEKAINLTVENRTLSVTAENTVGVHEDYTPTLAEIQEMRYRAAFELPERVDASSIRAEHRNGLLILTLPKREEVKPRRIAITAG